MSDNSNSAVGPSLSDLMDEIMKLHENVNGWCARCTHVDRTWYRFPCRTYRLAEQARGPVVQPEGSER